MIKEKMLKKKKNATNLQEECLEILALGEIREKCVRTKYYILVSFKLRGRIKKS